MVNDSPPASGETTQEEDLKDAETVHRAADSAEANMAGGTGGNHPDGHLRAPASAGNDYRPDVVGGVDRAAKVTDGEYSPKPRKSRSLKARSDHSPRQETSAEVIDIAAFKASVTIHSPAFFDDEKWKRSRIKKGYLIMRIQGYDPVESEYGVHYLKVLSRRPKKTSGDYSLYEHAGFFTWSALQAGGRLVRERKRYERVSSDSANAS